MKQINLQPVPAQHGMRFDGDPIGGKQDLYFTYTGEGYLDFMSFTLT